MNMQEMGPEDYSQDPEVLNKFGRDVNQAVKDGKIEERGTHRELMKKRGYYYSLYTRQYEESILELHQ